MDVFSVRDRLMADCCELTGNFLDRYDTMADADRAIHPYQTTLDPPGPRPRHAPRE